MDNDPREITKNYKSKSYFFLCSACCLMFVDIHMKFREDSLKGFQVIEWT